MTVNFKFEIGQKVFRKDAAEEGKLIAESVRSASVVMEKDTPTKYYYTASGISYAENRLVNEYEALLLAANFHQSRVDSINSVMNTIYGENV